MYLHTTSGTLTAEEIAGYGTKLKTMDAVGAVAPATVSTDQATAEYTVTLLADPESTTAVNTVKNGLRPQAHAAAPPGTYALVGGTTAMFSSPSLTALVGNRAWWPGHQGDRR